MPVWGRCRSRLVPPPARGCSWRDITLELVMAFPAWHGFSFEPTESAGPCAAWPHGLWCFPTATPHRRPWLTSCARLCRLTFALFALPRPNRPQRPARPATRASSVCRAGQGRAGGAAKSQAEPILHGSPGSLQRAVDRSLSLGTDGREWPPVDDGIRPGGCTQSKHQVNRREARAEH